VWTPIPFCSFDPPPDQQSFSNAFRIDWIKDRP
jgi:hypothetical protein